MSEPRAQPSTAGFAGHPAAGEALTGGTLMRRAREAAGLHVAALAVSLKVPVRKLEALENDRWDELPDAVFARALASSVCRTLKIDAQPVLDRLPQTAAPRLVATSDGINATFRSPGDGTSARWRDQLSRPVFLAVSALLLGALVMIALPSLQQSELVASILNSGRAVLSASSTAGSPATAVQAAATSVPAANGAQPLRPDLPQVASPQVAYPAAAGAPLVDAAPAPASATPVVAAMAPVPAGSAAGAASSPRAGVDPAPVADAVATPAGEVIVFQAKGPSWVEVTDARGVVAVRRLLGAGEAAGASGALPLRVIIGRVDATEVQVRGKPFDLQAVSQNNVARFEVR